MLPLQVPTRTIQSLGPVKQDLDRPPRYDVFVTAPEWNLLCDQVIALTSELNQLGLAGNLGTLQAAYNNTQVGNPVTVTLDAVRGGVIFADSAAGLGQVLLGVSRNDGSVRYGFTSNGLQLPNTTSAVFTPNGVTMFFTAGQNNGTSPYILDTASAQAGTVLTLKNAANNLLTVDADGSLALWKTGLGIQYGFVPVAEGVALATSSATIAFVPGSPPYRLGSAASPWGGVFARYYASRTQAVAWAQNITLDAKLGNVATINVPFGIQSVTIVNGEQGMILTLLFVNNGGPRVESFAANIKINKNRFPLSRINGVVDALLLVYDGSTWHELGRKVSADPASGVSELALAGGVVSLVPGVSPRTQSFSGTLTNDLRINLDETAAVEGDSFDLIFPEVTGLITDAAKRFLITTQNGAVELAVFDQVNKAMRGRIYAYYTGTAWKVSIGAAVLYS